LYSKPFVSVENKTTTTKAVNGKGQERREA
jgi:hypothetical protein